MHFYILWSKIAVSEKNHIRKVEKMFTDKPESYRGVYSLLLTPFKEDKSIDYDVYAQYVEWQVERGSHHLFSV